MQPSNKNEKKFRSVKKSVLLVALGIGVVFGVYFLLGFIFPPPPPPPSGICPPNDPTCEERGVVITYPEDFTKRGKDKASFVQELASNPIIQTSLRESNEKDSTISDLTRLKIYATRDREWVNAKEPTPFMVSVMKNDISDFLRDNLVVPSEEHGELLFGEHIITNIYGATIATSIRTDNFDQSQDNWWKQAKKEESLFAQRCNFDVSAEMYSEDIITKIYDDKGEAIGVINSATPCNVTLLSETIDTKIEPVLLDNVTPIGHYKISHLQELLNNPLIQIALKKSNEEFSAMTDEDIAILTNQTDWPKPYEDRQTALQTSILNNEVSNLLRENIEIQTEEYGTIYFPELILTNSKGVNIASTDRTFNYIQNEYEWWKIAKEDGYLIRNCGFDRTINDHSEDIILSAYDEMGEFAGILNSATGCNVVLKKPPYFYGNSDG